MVLNQIQPHVLKDALVQLVMAAELVLAHKQAPNLELVIDTLEVDQPHLVSLTVVHMEAAEVLVGAQVVLDADPGPVRLILLQST